MSNLKVTLYIRITTPEGKRKMCKPVYASRGRLSPSMLPTQKATVLDITRRASTTSDMLVARRRSATIHTSLSTDTRTQSRVAGVGPHRFANEPTPDCGT